MHAVREQCDGHSQVYLYNATCNDRERRMDIGYILRQLEDEGGAEISETREVVDRRVSIVTRSVTIIYESGWGFLENMTLRPGLCLRMGENVGDKAGGTTRISVAPTIRYVQGCGDKFGARG